MAFGMSPGPMSGPAPAMAPMPMAAPNAYGMEPGLQGPAVPEAEAPQGVPLSKLKQWFLAYQDAKDKEMQEARSARLYYHGSQWTDEELRVLTEQGRPPLVNNRISLKIDGIVGTLDRLRQDPKASARTQAYEAGAMIGTAAVREVLDTNRWESLRQEVSHDLAVGGIGGVERDIESDSDGNPNTVLRRVDPETFFYDPRSVRADFHDARFLGVYKWVDLDAAIELLPDSEHDLRDAVDVGATQSPSQQDWEKNWYDARLDRVKLVECWYKHRGEWWFALHTGDMILKEGPSPYRDEKGKTRCRYNMASAGIDQDGDRYGFFRNMRSAQDEINHRRSKLLWIMNVNQVFVEDGTIDDPEKLRRDLAKPDSVITYRPAPSGNKGFEIRDQSQQMQGQAQLLAEAKQEIDLFGPNPELLGTGPGTASGRAIALQQQAGIAQLGPYFGRFKAWKLHLYREIWRDVKQFWTNERLIRIAGPEGMQFIPVNTLVMTPEGPRIANSIGELDLDIVMDEGPDTVTLREDVLETLRQMIQQQVLSAPEAKAAFLELSDLSPVVKAKIEAAGQPKPEQIQQAQTVQGLQLRAAASKIAETEARTQKLQADAVASQGEAHNSAILAEQHAVNTAATIADMAHKRALTDKISSETAAHHMAALAAPPVAPGAPAYPDVLGMHPDMVPGMPPMPPMPGAGVPGQPPVGAFPAVRANQPLPPAAGRVGPGGGPAQPPILAVRPLFPGAA